MEGGQIGCSLIFKSMWTTLSSSASRLGLWEALVSLQHPQRQPVHWLHQNLAARESRAWGSSDPGRNAAAALSDGRKDPGGHRMMWKGLQIFICFFTKGKFFHCQQKPALGKLQDPRFTSVWAVAKVKRPDFVCEWVWSFCSALWNLMVFELVVALDGVDGRGYGVSTTSQHLSMTPMTAPVSHVFFHCFLHSCHINTNITAGDHLVFLLSCWCWSIKIWSWSWPELHRRCTWATGCLLYYQSYLTLSHFG